MFPLIASGSVDSGTIAELFVTPAGAIAIKLRNGFQSAVSAGEFPSSNGWAANTNADPLLKATLLTAKASGQAIRVVISGCEVSTWWRIATVYVQ